MLSGPRAPAGAVPHTLKTTTFLPAFCLLSSFVSLPPESSAALSLFDVEPLTLVVSALLESFELEPPPATALMRAIRTKRPTRPRQPRPMTFPAPAFFGGGGANGGCPKGCWGPPHPGCCGGYCCWLIVPPGAYVVQCKVCDLHRPRTVSSNRLDSPDRGELNANRTVLASDREGFCRRI